MIGARRMNNVRSECERVIQAGVPGDFMETGVWRGGACIMMRAVLAAYQIADRRVIAADSFAGFPTPCRGAGCAVSTSTPTRSFAVSLARGEGGVRPLRSAGRSGRIPRRAVQGHAAGGASRSAGCTAPGWGHVREHEGWPRQSLPQALTGRHADRRRLFPVRIPAPGRRRVSCRACASPIRSFRSITTAATGSSAPRVRSSHMEALQLPYVRA